MVAVVVEVELNCGNCDFSGGGIIVVAVVVVK